MRINEEKGAHLWKMQLKGCCDARKLSTSWDCGTAQFIGRSEQASFLDLFGSDEEPYDGGSLILTDGLLGYRLPRE